MTARLYKYCLSWSCQSKLRACLQTNILSSNELRDIQLYWAKENCLACIRDRFWNLVFKNYTIYKRAGVKVILSTIYNLQAVKI